MPLLILSIITIFFSLIGFISNTPQQGIDNSFLAYCTTEMQFIVDHLLAFLLGVISLLLFFTRFLGFHKNYSNTKIYVNLVVQFMFTLLLGFALAYGVLLIVAFSELNVLAMLTNSNSQILGIESNIQNITHTLQTDTQAPQIIASDRDQYREVLAIATATTGTDTVYGKYFLQAIPHFLVIPIQKPNASILLIDNTLIVTQLDPLDMQAISPYIGYLFIKQYFPERNIKFYPKVTIMDKKQYIQFR